MRDLSLKMHKYEDIIFTASFNYKSKGNKYN